MLLYITRSRIVDRYTICNLGTIELSEMTDVISELFEMSGNNKDEGVVLSQLYIHHTLSKQFKHTPNCLVFNAFNLTWNSSIGSKRARKIFARLDVDDNGELGKQVNIKWINFASDILWLTAFDLLK